MKFILIVNPFSGKKQGLEIFNKIKKKFNSKQIDLTLITTEFPGHAEKIINECIFGNCKKFEQQLKGVQLLYSWNFFVDHI